MEQRKKSGYDNKDTVIRLIENTAKEIKGDDYDLRKISYEADGAGDILFDWSYNTVKQKGNLIGRNLMFTTTYEKEAQGNDTGWSSYNFFINKAGMSEDDLTLGTNNHDNFPVHKIAKEKKEWSEFYNNPIPILSKTFNVPKNVLKNPQKWVELKMSEPFLTSRRFLYFMDVFGKDVFIGSSETSKLKDYFRYRLDKNFEKEYHKELQTGNAFNYPQTLARIMKTKGLDKKFPSLYNKLTYLGKYLRRPGVITQQAADKKVEKTGHDEVLDTLSKM